MAMEIKTLEVANSDEVSTINFWQQFGWTLKSSQRVFNKNSHLEQRGNDTYSVTETVDFTKLVFERDKNGPNYAQIAALENRYFQINIDIKNAEREISLGTNALSSFDFRTKKQKFITLACFAVSVILVPIGFSSAFFLGLVGVAGIFLSIKSIKHFKKKAIELAEKNPDSENGKIYLEALHSKVRPAAERRTMLFRQQKEILETLETLI